MVEDCACGCSCFGDYHERKIFTQVVGRTGVYYRHDFIDDASPGDIWSDLLGAGFGFSYSPLEKLRIDIGADVPFIHKTSYYADSEGFTSKSNSEEFVYRAGVNLTWFF